MNTDVNEYTEYGVSVEAMTAIDRDFKWVRLHINCGNQSFAEKTAAGMNDNRAQYRDAHVVSRNIKKEVTPWVRN